MATSEQRDAFNKDLMKQFSKTVTSYCKFFRDAFIVASVMFTWLWLGFNDHWIAAAAVALIFYGSVNPEE